MLLERSRLDAQSNRNTAGFITGYRGSPLGGFDLELGRASERLKEANIVFQPAINEDLGATAAWGTQQVGLFEDKRYDGVYSLWYGKSPGLDRSTDAIRHANMAGTAPLGGVLAVVGDDPDCKSSTLPSDSAGLLRDLNLPILDPTDVEELISFGLYGWELSRFSGCWVAVVAQTSVMDSSATVELNQLPSTFKYPSLDFDPHIRLTDTPHEQERRLASKLDAVLGFVQANPINLVVTDPHQPKLTIVTTGKSYTNVRQSLKLLGLDQEQAITNSGIRILKLGLIWPIDRDWLRKNIEGSQAVLVVESKSAFLETELRSTLYGTAHVPIVGKHDFDGKPLLTPFGELQIDDIVVALRKVRTKLNLNFPRDSTGEPGSDAKLARLAPMNLSRKPLFCPGCPHAHSTKLPEASRAFAGIGCHYMAQWMHRETYLFTHMGGEGANWIGQAPFTDTSHVFVNLGDGTYSHSGLLAIRAAVAANVNVTYKILFNDAVAMTGGQAVDGNLTVADVVAQVKAVGVSDVRVVAEDISVHKGAPYKAVPRSDLQSVQRELRKLEGCSVLIVDHACANEKRRKQKRNLLPQPSKFVVINESVCEGCGDCVVQSGCSAIVTVPTRFGDKKQIDQTHCIQDMACVDGYCPALVEVSGSKKSSQSKPLELNLNLAEPDAPSSRTILIAGVGGTGIVTLSQIIAVASHLEGKQASTLDMTGLAQKGGAVISHVRVGDDARWRTRLSHGDVDLLIGADAVTSQSAEIVSLLSNKSTHAVVNHRLMPSYRSVVDRGSDYEVDNLLSQIRNFVATTDTLDAVKVASTYGGNGAVANTVLLGYAYQRGFVPLSSESIRRAIELNGVAIEANLSAFEAGRFAATDEFTVDVGELQSAGESALETIISDRVLWLTDYQDKHLAQEFATKLERVRQVNESVNADCDRFTRSVADVLFRLTAVKDEYEVARLLTESEFSMQISEQFDNASIGYVFSPTWLRGSDQSKVRFGSWLTPVLRGIARFKSLRGRWCDPFRFSVERKFDRYLRDEFTSELDHLLEGLDQSNYECAIEIVGVYQQVKGFGHVRKNTWLSQADQLNELRQKFLNDRSFSVTSDNKLPSHKETLD